MMLEKRKEGRKEEREREREQVEDYVTTLSDICTRLVLNLLNFLSHKEQLSDS